MMNVIVANCRLYRYDVTYVFQDDIDADLDVNNDMANRMSLFYAHATPMLRVLSDATTKFVSQVRYVSTSVRLRPYCHAIVVTLAIKLKPVAFLGNFVDGS